MKRLVFTFIPLSQLVREVQLERQGIIVLRRALAGREAVRLSVEANRRGQGGLPGQPLPRPDRESEPDSRADPDPRPANPDPSP